MSIARNLQTIVSISEACERDCLRFGFSDRTLGILNVFLKMNPVFEGDVSDGQVVFRAYGHHVLVFTHGLSNGSHQICVLAIREYTDPTLFEKLKPWAERISLLKGLLA